MCTLKRKIYVRSHIANSTSTFTTLQYLLSSFQLRIADRTKVLYKYSKIAKNVSLGRNSEQDMHSLKMENNDLHINFIHKMQLDTLSCLNIFYLVKTVDNDNFSRLIQIYISILLFYLLLFCMMISNNNYWV